ncbi:ATP-dependent helicase HrpB [Vitiosangium sp. GDMCC 1.1324]|nr:ATP-dependent helicase HrpB [Vitiosangium sp. GDMCC 1.1324]
MTGIPVELISPSAQAPGVASAEKREPSRFDGVLAETAREAQAVGAARPAESVRAVEGVKRAESPSFHFVTRTLSSLEQGQVQLDQLIQRAASGATFSNSELLLLQASMSRYTLELDLVSKVVEKGTSGLKDVLKTQV